jgi:hypothetical protein
LSHIPEYGQRYVAISAVKRPENLCMLLPDSSNVEAGSHPYAIPLQVLVDRDMAHIISGIYSNPIGEGEMHSSAARENSYPRASSESH